MDILGSFALLLALLAAVYAVAAGIAGIITRRTLLTKSARNAGMAVFVLVTIAVGCLEYFFFTNDFSIVYVVEHSNRALPASINLPRSGPVRKARCFSGPGCFQSTRFSSSS